LYKKLPFDVSKDFTWITQLSETPLVLLANNDFPVNNITELIELAKQQPNKLNYGSSGPGGSIHLHASKPYAARRGNQHAIAAIEVHGPRGQNGHLFFFSSQVPGIGMPAFLNQHAQAHGWIQV